MLLLVKIKIIIRIYSTQQLTTCVRWAMAMAAEATDLTYLKP